MLTQSIEALDQLVQESGVPLETIHHDGWILYRSEGRTTYSYPPAIKALEASLKSDKELAVALGTATAKVGQPFWTIKQSNNPLF